MVVALYGPYDSILLMNRNYLWETVPFIFIKFQSPLGFSPSLCLHLSMGQPQSMSFLRHNNDVMYYSLRLEDTHTSDTADS